MSRHRFFLTEPLSAPSDGPVGMPLSDADVHHALDVLRIVSGEEIVVVEPGGTTWVASVTDITGRELTGRLTNQLDDQPTLLDLTLIQGIAKGPTMDSIVQHAVEIGVARIVPVITERTVVRLDPARTVSRTTRWQRIAEGAARQSQRSRIPQVDAPVSLAEVPAMLAGFGAVLVLWEESGGPGVVEALRAGVRVSGGVSFGETPSDADVPRVAVIVGPEGGFSPAEVAMLVDAGAVECTLGAAILRAETASLAALTLTAYALGGMGASARDLDHGVAR